MLSPPDRCPSAWSPSAALARVTASPPGAPGGFSVPLTGVGGLPGSFEGVGQLEHEGKTVIGRTGVGVRVEEVEGAEVVPAGVVVAEPCGGLPRGEEGVGDRVVFGAGAGGDQVRRRSGPRWLIEPAGLSRPRD